MAGDRLEIRGPIGGWFVWRPYQREPVQLIAGGSGVVPLMAMIRTRSAMQNAAPFRLLYSVREPAAVFYRHELATLDENGNGVNVSYAYTRATPEGWPRPPHRIDAKTLSKAVWPADAHPTCYVCGPTPFVETVSNLLIAAGHEAGAIKTERFGPTGERQ
jgi:ferredoxin-NADP reductase